MDDTTIKTQPAINHDQALELGKAFTDYRETREQYDRIQALFLSSRKAVNRSTKRLMDAIGNKYIHHKGRVYWVQRMEGAPDLLRSTALTDIGTEDAAGIVWGRPVNGRRG